MDLWTRNIAKGTPDPGVELSVLTKTTVVITSFYTNFLIKIKHQDLDQTSTSIYWQKICFKIQIKLQPQNLVQLSFKINQLPAQRGSTPYSEKWEASRKQTTFPPVSTETTRWRNCSCRQLLHAISSRNNIKVLRCYLQQPESHQSSLLNKSQSVSDRNKGNNKR